jgi:hypothetical protein
VVVVDERQNGHRAGMYNVLQAGSSPIFSRDRFFDHAKAARFQQRS